MLKPDKAYKDYIEKADAGISFLDAKIREKSTVVEDVDAWITASELSKNATAPNYLIDNILESKTHGLLAGGSQSFKSFCVLKIAHSICTGKDFFGHEVYETGKVLYICGEGMGALGRRIRALDIVEGDMGNNFIAKKRPLAIDNIADMDWLRLQINEIKPVLVVFDTFSSLATSTGENINEEVARALRMVSDACSDSGSSSIIVHHYGKDVERGSRGASAFSANVDFEFSMSRVNSSMSTVLSCKKTKDGDYFDDIALNAYVVDLGLLRQNGKPTTSLILKVGSVLHDLTERQTKALEIISDLIQKEGIADYGHWGVNETQIRKAFNAAFKDDVSNPYKLFSEIIPALKKKQKLEEDESFFWLK